VHVKYMLLINAAMGAEDGQVAGCGVEEWMAYDKAVKDAGVFVSGESLADLVTATRVRVATDGRPVVTDGPFAETHEVLGGFYVIDVPNIDAALDWASRCPGAREGGSIIVRPIAEFGG
jgi:hypothetical protein